MELLSEIENIMDTVDFDDIVWNGDLNYDPSRTSGFVKTISRFLERLGLVSLWDHFPVDYTHIHTDFKSTSTLDHFVVNKLLAQQYHRLWGSSLGGQSIKAQSNYDEVDSREHSKTN